MNKFIGILFILSLQYSNGWSQNSIGVSLNTDSIDIGEAVVINIQLYTNQPQSIKAIDYSIYNTLKSENDKINYDSLDYYAEVEWPKEYESSPFKKKSINSGNFTATGNQYSYKDSLVLKFWDPGVFQIPSPDVIMPNDSILEINSLQSPMLLVSFPRNLVNPDTTSLILPIKDILREQKNIKDFIWILYLLLPFLLLLLAYLIYKKRKDKAIEIEPDPVLLPAYMIANQKLKILKEQELWKSGDIKKHQSELTHIIREYLENRFDIKALESTTDQITRDLRSKHIDLSLENELIQILQIADMVKFAKASPPIDINEQFLYKAEDFVLKTKIQLSLEEENEILKKRKEYENALLKKRKRNRK